MDIRPFYPDDVIFGTEENKMKEFIDALRKRDWKRTQRRFGKRVTDNMDPTPLKIDTSYSTVSTGTFGWVYKDATYEGKNVVVKRLRDPDTNISTFLIEAVIQCILHNYTKETDCHIQVPEIYKFGKATFEQKVYRNRRYQKEEVESYAIVMQQINGKEIHKYEGSSLNKKLTNILFGLQSIQNDLAFVHRDFHAKNIMVYKGTPYIIDFGRSCIGAFKSRPMYDKMLWFGTNCKNRSHDICYLIINLVTSYQKYELKEVAVKICDRYREKVASTPNKNIEKDIKYTGYHWTDSVFHWHYVGFLEEVELEPYIPKNLLMRGLQCLVCKIKF